MKNINTVTNDFNAITSIVKSYFEGLYHGDVGLLSTIFHPDVWLKAPSMRRSLSEWMADVATRSSPAEQGLPFNFKLLSIDIVQDQAMVKIHCPLFDFNYIDFLGLLKEENKWLIVNKMYSDIKQLNG